MEIDRSLVTRSTSLMLLKLLEQEDMYGYRMIEELARRSDQTFSLKAGTLYPLLHTLLEQGCVECYEKTAENGRVRKYYTLTRQGRRVLAEKQTEWETFSSAVDKVLAGGCSFASI